MLNEIHLEGAVTHTWVFRDVQFARIACRIGHGRQRVSESDGRPSEYITLRFEPPTLARAASTLAPGHVVRANGYLSSREYNLTLKNFAESAEGDEDALSTIRELAKEAGGRVHKPHVLNEIVVERFSVVEEGQQNGPGQPSSSDVRVRRRERRPRKEKSEETAPETTD